jgi:putative spermidine/putrescine transport system substrate-binding protein
MKILSRRTFLAAAAGGTALAAPALVRAQARELVMVGYGTVQDEPIKRVGAELARRHPGVSLRVIGGLSAEAIAQIKAARGASPYDFAVMGSPAIINAVDEGVLQPLDPKKVPSLSKVDPKFLPYAHNMGVPVNFSGIGVAYNKQTIPNPPKTWADLWKPEYAGKIGLARPQSNLGLGCVSIAARAFGRPDEDTDFGLAKWRELKPLVGRSPPLLQQMLERGEIGLCPLWHDNTAIAASSGLPFGYVKATPGPIILPSSIVMFTRTAFPDLVHEFAELFLAEEQQRFGTQPPYFFGPTVSGIPTPPAAADYLPSTPEEIASMTSVDWTKVAPRRGRIVEAFDRLFAA